MSNVWVFAEKQEAMAELCAGGRQLGETVSAIVLGAKAEAEKVIRMGADHVYWLGELQADNIFENYMTTIAQLVKTENPDLLLIQASRRGKLLAGHIAALMGTSVLPDAVEISAGSKFQVTHRVYGGAALRTETAAGKTTVTTVGAGIFAALPEEAARSGKVTAVDYIEPAVRIKPLARKKKEVVSVNLGAAKCVVSLGRGIANQDDIKMVQELANQIGAEVGCSRPIAEGLGWLPTERYIGVSGVMLKPDVYVAVGISGQMQHMVGINQAKTIIAINKDKAAPIFKKADYGIVGDLYKVLPLLLDKLKAAN